MADLEPNAGTDSRAEDRLEPLPESETNNFEHGANRHDLESVHERAMRRFDTVAVPQRELRAQSLEARRFVTISGAQWEGPWLEQFENTPRPEVDKITKSLEKIETDYRENRLTVDFLPADDFADDETADTLDGCYRADSAFFGSDLARDNAFKEGIRGGFGAYRATEDHEDPDDPENENLRVNPARIIVDADQCVYFDGASVLYNHADAEWAFVVSADPRILAEEKWGAGNLAAWPLVGWQYAWDWYTPDLVRTAEYYEVEHVADRLITFTQGISGETQRYYDSEIDGAATRELRALGWKSKAKKVDRRRVHKYVLNGTKVLKDCGFILGPKIPVIPYYGRFEFVDNMIRWRGHVAKRMDSQRIYNASIGKVVETQSLSPFDVPIVDPDQVDPVILEQWARGNIDRTPLRLLKVLRNPDGSIAQAGPIGKIEPPQVPPATVGLLTIASADLTDQDDNADQVKSNISADAMDIAAARVDAKSGIYLDNMRLTIQWEGEVYKGKAREAYYEPGRKIATLTADGKDSTATIAEPYLDQNNVYRIRNDLSQGAYKVVSSVQESTATKRQKTVRQSMELAAVATQAQAMDLAQASLLTATMNMDGEGQDELQTWARNKLIALGVVKPTPEEAQQIAQAQAAQGQQPPSPADQALMATAAQAQSQAELNKASSVDKLAAAHLKGAQAEALGGPDSAPTAPTGLQKPPETPVETISKLAGARLKVAQADHLQHDMAIKTHDAGVKRVKTGADILAEHRRQQLAEHQALAEHLQQAQQQPLAEQQPAGTA
jgi:hypothetical protein